MRPIIAAGLLTVTTLAPGRASRRSSSKPVRAKWPRWLVPNCISKPSAVSRRGMAITPALLTRMFKPSCSAENPAANFRTEARSARSSGSSRTSAAGTGWRIRSRASAPLAWSRQARTTLGAGPGQCQCRLEAQAAVGPGHHGSATSEVRDVVCGPPCHERGPYAERRDLPGVARRPRHVSDRVAATWARRRLPAPAHPRRLDSGRGRPPVVLRRSEEGGPGHSQSRCPSSAASAATCHRRLRGPRR